MLLLLLLRLPLLSHCCCSCCGWLPPPLLLLPAASHFPRHECELEAAKHAAEMLGVSVRSLRKKDRVCTLAVEERLRAIQPLLQGKPPHDIEAANPETGWVQNGCRELALALVSANKSGRACVYVRSCVGRLRLVG